MVIRKKATTSLKTTTFRSITSAIRMASAGMKEVSCVALLNGDSILFGQRNDNLLWSLPGGHIDDNETPHQAALREVFEETGIKIPDRKGLVYLGHKLTSQGVMVHAFRYDVASKPDVVETMTMEHDPDKEFRQLKWVHMESQEWNEVMSYSHCPRNIVLEFMGLQ